MDWKKEFLDLYSEDTPESITNALALKREHLPQKLYRYRSIANDNLEYRKREIILGEIYMARPVDFNDPFEGCSILHSTDPASYLNNKRFVEAFAASNAFKDICDIFDSEDWVDKLIDLIIKEQFPDKDPVATAASPNELFMFPYEEMNANLTGMTRNFNRIACFSTKSNNLPMWYHYANAHTGFCLEYDSSSIKNEYPINRLFPVYYVDKLPDMTFTLFQKIKRPSTSLDLLSIHKLDDWNYEDEWRLIYNTSTWYDDPEKVPPAYYKAGMPTIFTLPSRVLLGKDISNRNEDMIRNWAESVHIDVVKAQCTEYGFVFV